MSVKKTPRRYNKSLLRQIEGRNAVREALRADTPVIKILIEDGMKFDDRIYEIYNLARARKIPIEKIYSRKLLRMSKTKGHHQGIIAQAEKQIEKNVRDLLNQIEKQNKTPFFIILTNVLYEQNLGAVLRSAESVGANAVIVSKKSPELTPVVERAAVGAGEHIPLIHENLFSTLNFLRENGIKIFAAREGENKSLYRCNFNIPLALVIGAEDKGISEPISEHVDQFISIPMLGKIESLNMSVAAAVCMYEIIRQRKYTE